MSKLVSLEEVLAAIKTVRERHTPPQTYVGQIPSEALRALQEVGYAVLKLPTTPDPKIEPVEK